LAGDELGHTIRRLLVFVAISTALAIAVVLPAKAGNGSIGLYFDSDLTTCSRTVDVGIPFELFVSATLDGGTSAGIVGAEFRIAGLPAGWLTNVTPNPAASLAYGDPFVTGCDIGFPDCQQRSPGVLLYTIAVTPTSPVVNQQLQVTLHPGPLCMPFCAIFLWDCDAPAFHRYPVTGGAAVLNGSCNVAVTSVPWGVVKILYH